MFELCSRVFLPLEVSLRVKIITLKTAQGFINGLSDCNSIWTHIDLSCNQAINHLVHLTVCSYHVTCTFQSGSRLYNCLNVKELLAWNRHKILSLIDCNGIQTDNKQTLWLNGWVFVYELIGCGCESRCSQLKLRYCACFEQGVPLHSGNYRM